MKEERTPASRCVSANPNGLGVFWQIQGSWKSSSMVCFAVASSAAPGPNAPFDRRHRMVTSAFQEGDEGEWTSSLGQPAFPSTASSFRISDHPCATWTEACANWLRHQGFLKPRTQP